MFITAETLRPSLDGLKLKLTYDIMDFCIVKFGQFYDGHSIAHHRFFSSQYSQVLDTVKA